VTAARLARPDLPFYLAGGTLTVVTAVAAIETNGPLVLTVLAGLAFFLGTATCFVVAPHLAVAATIPLFAMLPAIRTLAFPTIGPIKDLVTLAAGAAVAVLATQARDRGRTWIDSRLGFAIAALFGLYVVNLGGLLGGTALDAGWMHGVRLVAEPFILLLVGFAAGGRRTLRWAIGSLSVTAVLVALYGIYQQLIGPGALVGMGYEYDSQVRTIGARLRSFGTLDEPFAYAAFLLFGLCAALFWYRRSRLAVGVGSIVAIGIIPSQVRSAAIVGVALLGIWLARRRLVAVAGFVLASAVVAAATILIVLPGATRTETLQTSESTYLTVNGRTEAWRVVLSEPSALPLGKGVGLIGTAAERADRDAQVGVTEERNTTAVDSGYFAALADVGIAGLVLIIFILGRLAQLAARAALDGKREGWLAIALLVTLSFDAVTRSSFTAFPTAFLGFLLVGLALADAGDGEGQGGAPSRAAANAG
jgi:O-antigen ligase/polysaccharide polymerase Wzy-like membrane protein